jgi:DNA-binding GntR family transcriptional regulator
MVVDEPLQLEQQEAAVPAGQPKPANGRPAVPDDRALRHVVTQYILDELASGRLAPGARVAETTLAETLGVSFSPVREALFRLTEQGLLEHRPRRGFFVGALEEEQIRQIYTFRAALEGFAARTIVERRLAAASSSSGHASPGGSPGGAPDDARVPDPLAALEAIAREGELAAYARDPLALANCNTRFHDLLVHLADHPLLNRSWTMLAPARWLLIPGSRPTPVTPTRAASWIERHYRLLRLLRGDDPAAAEREAAEHVRAGGQYSAGHRFPLDALNHRPLKTKA